jgi:asparagine synthase (glutamine-hydrolysing)|tara:strand:- start:1484 stop:3433 length:1950 start_codon:yes stop_codon:yes gene_type:complete
MCGILGLISYKNTIDINKERFTESLNLQEHRGPDDFSIYVDQKFTFGHRRLSIIDLESHSKQPMLSKDSNVIITFNGEIYNYKELKHDLLQKGYQFSTESDTEVLLYSYYEYGIDCINKFIGMFAFAIYDKRNNKSYIVRDRLGIKPLYFYKIPDGVMFSSEIKSMLHYQDIKPSLNIGAVSSYLSFRYPVLNDTFFNEIDSLQPGCYLEVSENGYEEVQYWNPSSKFKEQNVDKGEQYYIDELKRLLHSSVELRMRSDVPFGAFLSGGVDSSVITAIMSEISDDPIKTYTVGFEEEGFNEFSYANIIADKFKTEHVEISVSCDDYFETMSDLILFKDAPLSVPNEVPLYLLSKELKKHITVVLSGEGADEIFGGYGRIFRSPLDYERMGQNKLKDLKENEIEIFNEKLIAKYRTNEFKNEVEHFINIYSYTSFRDKETLLNDDLELASIETDFVGKFQKIFDELGDDSYYNKMMYAFEKVHLLGLLQRVDTTTMASSVEARVPFVDHRLVEFAFTIPLKYKLKWKSDGLDASKILLSDEISEIYDTPKYILKKAYEGVVPDEVLYRKKMGFPVPLDKWFGGSFGRLAKDILLSKAALGRGLYSAEGIKKWLNDPELLTDHSKAMKIWMLINVEIFCKQYFDEYQCVDK